MINKDFKKFDLSPDINITDRKKIINKRPVFLYRLLFVK